MLGIVKKLNLLVWGAPALLLIIGVGIYLTLCTRFIQFRAFPGALADFVRPLFNRGKCNDRSKRRALYTALAATVGTGNIAGVAGVICLGGPGAVFWMWISGLLAMVTKLAEATLAQHYKKVMPDGRVMGGPMYMILGAMKKRWHWLAYAYCFFGVVAAFGIGNGTQINALVSGVEGAFGEFGIEIGFESKLAIGIFLSAIIFCVLSGGANRIGKAAEKLVPFAALIYILLCVIVLIKCWDRIPGAFQNIVLGAFQPRAVTGGAIGSLLISVRTGVARGVFTNEAGMGTASIAHAQSTVKDPLEQGYMGIVEVFIDTILICTLTALVILCSGTEISYGQDPGILLTKSAFTLVCGKWVSVAIAVCLCLFALATVFGWGLYGMQCATFLFGDRSIKTYILLQAAIVAISSVMRTDTLWLFAETVNGLMAIPNLIVLAKLAPQLHEITKCHPQKRMALS